MVYSISCAQRERRGGKWARGAREMRMEGNYNNDAQNHDQLIVIVQKYDHDSRLRANCGDSLSRWTMHVNRCEFFLFIIRHALNHVILQMFHLSYSLNWQSIILVWDSVHLVNLVWDRKYVLLKWSIIAWLWFSPSPYDYCCPLHQWTIFFSSSLRSRLSAIGGFHIQPFKASRFNFDIMIFDTMVSSYLALLWPCLS